MSIRKHLIGKNLILNTVQLERGAIVSYIDSTEKVITVIGYCYAEDIEGGRIICPI